MNPVRSRSKVGRECRSYHLMSLTLSCLFITSFSPLLHAKIGSQQIETDLLIVGGTESGCAAAIQAARMGIKRILIVNDHDWLGGQFSSEALCAIDENRGPEGYGHGVPFPRNGLFHEIISKIEADNIARYGHARPGNTRVITTCTPAQAHQAFRDLLQPYISSGQVRLVSNYTVRDVELDQHRITSIEFHPLDSTHPLLKVATTLTIDATDWGDVIQKSGASYEFGPDLKATYGEPLAPSDRETYPITDMNPITYCMVLRETNQYEPIERPPHYDSRNYANHTYPRDPLWLYASRRLVDHYGFPSIRHPDMLLLCFPAFDYPLDTLPSRVTRLLEANQTGSSRKNIVEMTRAQRNIVFEDAKNYSLGFLYYLQTEVHDSMPDKQHSFRRFALTDEFNTHDRMPPKPYLRESLRLEAMYMMRQQDTTGYGGSARNFSNAMYHDGVACWQFEYDFHPTKRVFLDHKDPAGPWTARFRPGRTWGPPYSGRSLFPVRSMVPKQTDGLLGAQKNLGYSSIVSSAVRLHDQSMAIGQACGAVAAVSLKHQAQPRTVPWDATLLSDVWSGLCARNDGGTPATLWPFGDIDPSHPAFVAANQLAIRGIIQLSGDDVDFRPDDKVPPRWLSLPLDRMGKVVPANSKLDLSETTRGEYVIHLWNQMKDWKDRAFTRLSRNDADNDGIMDIDDALPLKSTGSSWPHYQPPHDADGIPDKIAEAEEVVLQVNFAAMGTVSSAGFVLDNGQKFDERKGFGWQRDISAHHRRRHRLEPVERDTFLFTRSHDEWSLMIENGEYNLTVCVGDSAHEQSGQFVTVNGTRIFENVDTLTGQFKERQIGVVVRNRRLRIEIGVPEGTTNTCINWIRITRKSSKF